MAFMIPQYTKEAFLSAPNRWFETEVCPAEVYRDLETFMDDIGTPTAERDQGEIITGKWWCRLSAPGYMDCTEWHGPFDTLTEARSEISCAYEVCPTTGEDHGDEYTACGECTDDNNHENAIPEGYNEQ